MNSGTGKSFCVVCYVQLLNRAGLTKRRQCCYSCPLQDCQKKVGIQSKQKIGFVCEAFGRSLRTGWILSVICAK